MTPTGMLLAITPSGPSPAFFSSRFRECDIVCRYGGEEFSIILPGANVEQAWSRAEFCRIAVESTNVQSGGKSIGTVTISLGIADSTEFSTPQEMVSAADAALYQAKRAGRNATRVCSNDPTALPTIPASTIHASWLALEEDVAFPVA